MKILILSFYYRPDLCAGSFRTSALVDELREVENVEIEIVTTLPNRYASFSAEAPEQESIENVKVHRVKLPNHSSGMLDQIFAFTRFYKEAITITKSGQYDLVYATSSRLFTAFLGRQIAKKKNLPLYLDIRDIFVDTIKDVLNPVVAKLLKPVLTLIERSTFKNATHINLVSEGFYDYFKSRYNKPSYSFFTNGIDEEFLLADKNKELSHDSQSATTILYAGNIGEGQGLHNIVPALADSLGDKYHIKIIGDGGRKNQLYDACKNLENVTLKKPVGRQELILEYSKADILFLHLNDYDAFEKVLPSKIFEYAAMGKPILAGVSGYSAKFITDNIDNALVFSPTDSNYAVEQTQKLVLGFSEREQFLQQYARRNIMQKMANDLLRVINENG